MGKTHAPAQGSVRCASCRHSAHLIGVWFQDNDKGISSENIICLARVFGMGDPDAVAAWRTELRAANKRLVSKRRERRDSKRTTEAIKNPTIAKASSDRNHRTPNEQNGLARLSERIFTTSDGFGIAMLVWAGFFLLCLVSFIVQNHEHRIRHDCHHTLANPNPF